MGSYIVFIVVFAYVLSKPKNTHTHSQEAHEVKAIVNRGVCVCLYASCAYMRERENGQSYLCPHLIPQTLVFLPTCVVIVEIVVSLCVFWNENILINYCL